MSELKTLADVQKEINKLIAKGVKISEATGEHFHTENEEYIPASSPSWEDYAWIREENYLPHDQGFWYSSSMQSC